MKNKLILFTGPSAVGKATIEHYLFKDKELKLELSVSATTRAPRINERDGVHYYFISDEEFDKKIENDEFIEWNKHFSNKYGTLKSEITRIQNEGKTPFIEVEVIGAKNIIEKFGGDDIISIFIAPPSIEKLKERILGRGTESEDQVNERLARVEEELTYKEIFDHVVYNDVIEDAVNEVKNIIKEGK